jgi:cob(I)alamin adenosyltransferase
VKIYTKGGDKGQTQVYADKPLRLSKSDEILECYGSLDELNAHLGLLVSLLNNSECCTDLQRVQTLLFQIGFAISANSSVSQTDIDALEQKIDIMQSQLPAQTSFILPGGDQIAAQAHVCRTLTRRAERRLVALTEKYPVPELCLAYVNRLSDYLFVLARWQNFQAGIADIKV